MTIPQHPTYCIECKVVKYPDPETHVCGYCARKRGRACDYPPTVARPRGADPERQARIAAEAERVARDMNAIQQGVIREPSDR